MYPQRTLETLKDNLNLFQVTFNHDLKQDKNAYNVIDDIFKIPLDHVCIPGLHVTLRVYLKLLYEFESFCKDMDLQIAHVLALDNEEHENIQFNKFVETLKEIQHMERSIAELEARRNVIIEELNWFVISQADYFDEEFYISTLKEVDDKLLSYNNNQLSVLKKENKFHADVGPCQTSIDKTLKELGVDRQAYFGGSIIGNHCDKILKDDNIDIVLQYL